MPRPARCTCSAACLFRLALRPRTCQHRLRGNHLPTSQTWRRMRTTMRLRSAYVPGFPKQKFLPGLVVKAETNLLLPYEKLLK